jgi:hypothetical protein
MTEAIELGLPAQASDRHDDGGDLANRLHGRHHRAPTHRQPLGHLPKAEMRPTDPTSRIRRPICHIESMADDKGAGREITR